MYRQVIIIYDLVFAVSDRVVYSNILSSVVINHNFEPLILHSSNFRLLHIFSRFF